MTQPADPGPDWSKPLDYYKWTMALAVAAVVYVPDRFLPASGLRFWAVLAAFLLLAASCVFGFLLFGGIAKRLSGRGSATPPERTLDQVGFIHLTTLIAGFLVAVVLYFLDSFLPVSEDPGCVVELRSEAGAVTLDLAECTIEGTG